MPALLYTHSTVSLALESSLPLFVLKPMMSSELQLFYDLKGVSHRFYDDLPSPVTIGDDFICDFVVETRITNRFQTFSLFSVEGRIKKCSLEC